MQACLWMYEWPQKQWFKYSISCHTLCAHPVWVRWLVHLCENVCVLDVCTVENHGKNWGKNMYFSHCSSQNWKIPILTKKYSFWEKLGEIHVFPEISPWFFPVCVCYVIEFCVLSRAAYKQQKVNILTEPDPTLGKIMGKFSQNEYFFSQHSSMLWKKYSFWDNFGNNTDFFPRNVLTIFPSAVAFRC